MAIHDSLFSLGPGDFYLENTFVLAYDIFSCLKGTRNRGISVSHA